jgi:hypothetical protein
MLRESSRLEGRKVDLQVITSGEKVEGGVPAERELVAFAEAAIGHDTDATRHARNKLVVEIGEQGMVDAACIIANFQRMVRIADGTGIPLDKPVAMVTAGIREELGINSFGAAGNTPPVKGFARLLGRLLNKIIPLIFRGMAKKN